jgi:glycosyltransferase involved in cell wall biosynthesis
VHLPAWTSADRSLDGRHRRIRVLQIIGALDFGGAEHVVANLATSLDPSRFDVSICCTRGLGKLVDGLRTQGVDVVLAAPPSRRIRHLGPLYLRNALARLRPDVIHTHTLSPLSVVGPLAFMGLAPPWIHTFHFGNYPYTNRWNMTIERVFAKAVTRLVAVSDAQRESIITHHGFDRTRITSIRNGVRANPHVDVTAARLLKRAELGLRPDETLVGTVAVLSEQKGITYLLQAVHEIVRVRPSIKVLIVGGGPLESELKRQVYELGLDSVVTFTGWRADVPEILTALDIFVMSSLWEAMPLALLEAMAARLPIVVTDVGDNRALVDGGSCAAIVPPRDASALASALLAFLAQPEQARALGERALARFREHFGIAAMAEAYASLYEQLGARTHAPRPTGSSHS